MLRDLFNTSLMLIMFLKVQLLMIIDELPLKYAGAISIFSLQEGPKMTVQWLPGCMHAEPQTQMTVFMRVHTIPSFPTGCNHSNE